MDILIGKGLGLVRLGSYPQDIPELYGYTLTSIPKYCSNFDGRREITVNHISYLFDDSKGLIAITLNEQALKKDNFKLFGFSIKNMSVDDITALLMNNSCEYEESVDPYEDGTIEDISALKIGLIFYFSGRCLESIEIFEPKRHL